MSFKITVASGKGGTGKTTVATNLYWSLVKNFDNDTLLVDCDVEEPDDLLFFKNAILRSEVKVTQAVPEINTSKCTYCRKCVEYCEYNAITVIPPVQYASIAPDLCHSCGACLYACQDDALIEKDHEIGLMSGYDVGFGKGLLEGRLKIGSAAQTPVIRRVKKEALDAASVILFDAPPGTSCSVVTSVLDADFVIMVTEPTPFGLHDLKIAVELIREMDLPFGVVINKAGLGDRAVYDYLEDEGIDILEEIPFNEEYARKFSEGMILSRIDKNYAIHYQKIIRKILEFKQQ